MVAAVTARPRPSAGQDSEWEPCCPSGSTAMVTLKPHSSGAASLPETANDGQAHSCQMWFSLKGSLLPQPNGLSEMFSQSYCSWGSSSITPFFPSLLSQVQDLFYCLKAPAFISPILLQRHFSMINFLWIGFFLAIHFLDFLNRYTTLMNKTVFQVP